MYTYLYGVCLLITFVLFVYMAQKNYNNIDIYQWSLILLIPIIIMAYWLKNRISNPETASALFCFIYLDSTIMYTVVLFSFMHTLGIKVKSWMKIVGYGLAGIQLAVVCLCFNTNLYYKTITISDTPMGNATMVTPGPLKIIHYIYLGLLFIWMITILIMSMKKKGAYAEGNLFIYLALLFGAVAVYFLEEHLNSDFTMLPVLYTIADLALVMRYESAHQHDISFLIAENHSVHDARGYVAVGMNGLFLCCNQKSYDFLPFLHNQEVDQPLDRNNSQAKIIYDLIQSFEMDNATITRFPVGSKTCEMEISYFSIVEDGKHMGYLLDLKDVTEEQKAMDIMATYNETLNAEVQIKTENIREMQRKIVLSMADMIENRDNNTGGHVKRTSDVIHILVDEIQRQGKIPISDQMADDIVRAAPTHDLGKITIDSSILNKPARLTDEEYTIMKTHSTKSGEMVDILLAGVEEDRFVKVAYNVARYHHERWDGRGYPEGLVGTMIPLEARIMAVADVYDALVSKRVYKEPMSFEKSASIMCECMGTQFDPNMKAVFLGCREKMEQYYLQNDR